MPLAPEQIHYRLRYVETLTMLVQVGQVLAVQVLFEYKGQQLKLNANQKNALKATLLIVCDDIDANADKAIALGGTVDQPTILAAQAKPSEALAYLSQRRQDLTNLLNAVQISVDVNNDLTGTIADEAPFKDMLATIGTTIKIWTAVERTKIQLI